MTAPAPEPLEDSPLRKWRCKRDRTLADLAEELETTEATLSRVETGANPPSRDLEMRIVKITSLSRDEIVRPWLERRGLERALSDKAAEAGA